MRIWIAALGLLFVMVDAAGAQERAAARAVLRADVTEAERIATISLESGGTVEFLELDLDAESDSTAVLVIEEGAYPSSPVLPGLSLDANATAADIHRALAPERPVPPALRITALRAPPVDSTPKDLRAPRGDREDPSEIDSGVDPPPPTFKVLPVNPPEPEEPDAHGQQEPADLPKPSGTRAAWFQSELCGYGARITWCWIDRSGTSTKSVFGVAIGATVYSCAGTARMRVQFRRFGKWKSYVSRDIPAGYYFSYALTGIPRTRRSRVEGSCYHHAGGGY